MKLFNVVKSARAGVDSAGAVNGSGWRSRPVILLVICGFVLCGAIVVGTVAALSNLYDRALAHKQRELQNLASALAGYMDHAFQSVWLVETGILEQIQARGIASVDDFEKQLSNLDDYEMLKDKISGLPHVRALSLISARGKTINHTLAWPPLDLNASDREFFKVVKSDSRITSYITELLRSHITGTWSIYVMRKVVGPNNEFLGLVFAVVQIEYFQKYFASLSLGEGSVLSLTQRDGTVLVRYPHREEAIGKSYGPYALFKDVLSKADSGVVRLKSSVDGQERLIAGQVLVKYPAVVGVGVTVDSVLAEWRNAAVYMGGAAILTTIVIGGVIVLVGRRIGQNLKSQNIQFDAALNNMSHGLCMFDAKQRLIVSNKRYAELYGLTAEQTKPGTTIREIIRYRIAAGNAPHDHENYLKERFNDESMSKPYQVTNRLCDGRYISVVHRPTANGGWVSTHEDVTEARRADERIKYLAHHDVLTGLPNREQFRVRLDQALKRVDRGDQLAVLYLDVDDFKAVNDTYGHLIGDELLKAVAERLRACTGEIDELARLGGDEFAIIQAAVDKPSDAARLAMQIQDVFKAPYDILGRQLIVEASIGIAVAPDDGVETEQLLKNADMAMYEAKAAGRGTFCFFKADIDRRVKARSRLEFDLRQAIMNDEFEIYYQPLVNLADGAVTGCEALLRWRHRERGFVSPDEFIPIAEETGLINQLGEWVLRTACAEAMAWPNEIKIAVNVSPIQFKNQSFPLTVISALAASGLSAHRLELEITETVLIHDHQAAFEKMSQLRGLGVRIAMDDFGTGYSSLSYLQRFPLDKIKVDRAFISNIVGEGSSSAIVEAIITIAKSRNITTVAEGVETQEQATLLRKLDCAEMQGYLFSPPQPAADIRNLLAAVRPTLKAIA